MHMKKLHSTLFVVFLISVISLSVFAHPGRTDSDGGHTNHSTGEYHYHHGYPEHDHPDGICPYIDDTNNNHSISDTKSDVKTRFNKIIDDILDYIELLGWLLALFFGPLVLGKIFKLIIRIVSFIITKVKPLAKDICVGLSVLSPLLFVIIGGSIWQDGGFDGTIMEQLFPALCCGLYAAFCMVIILSNLFKHSSIVWIIGAVSIFVPTVVVYMLNFTNVLYIGAVILTISVLLTVLIKRLVDKK